MLVAQTHPPYKRRPDSNTVVDTVHTISWCSGPSFCDCWRNLVECTRVRKLMTSTWTCCTSLPKHVFTVEIDTWSLDLVFYALHKPCLPPVNWDCVGESGILRWFCSASNKLGCFRELTTPPTVQWIGIVPAGHLDHSCGHFWHSFECHPRPWSCIRSEQYKVNILLGRT